MTLGILLVFMAAANGARGGFSPYAVAAGLGLLGVLTFAVWTGRSLTVAPRPMAVLVVLAGAAQLVPGFLYLEVGTAVVVAEVMAVTGMISGIVLLSRLPTRQATVIGVAVGVLGFLVAAVVSIRASPHPSIDVWYIVTSAAEHLGRNIYLTPLEIPRSVPHELESGFVYLPLTAVLLAPFRWSVGDVRWGLLVAVLITAAVVGRRDVRLGLLCVFLPGTLVVVESAWTEPTMSALLLPALVALCARRPRRLAGTALLLLALTTKQHLVVLLPVLAAWPVLGLRRVALAVAGAAAVCLPWVLADPKAFYDGAVGYHLAQPPRPDALTISAWLHDVGLPPPYLAMVLLAIAYVGLLAWRIRRTEPPGYTVVAACAAALLAVNLANKQAFLNQYWLVAVLVLLAASTGSQSAGSAGRSAATDSASSARARLG